MRTEAHAFGRAVGIAAVTAGVVALAGGGEAFWLCVPAALLAAATAGRAASLLGAGTTVAAGAASSASAGHIPSAPEALLVPAASVLVLLAVRKRLERERDAMRASAFSDPLTGVANRRSLLQRIEYEIARHARARRSFAVVMLDLDGFKLVNDDLGHPAGDQLLCDVAAALQGAVRGQDTVARIGGDEFCLLAPETDGAGARRLTDRAVAAVGLLAAGPHILGASAGAAVFPDDGTTIKDLVEAADRRLLTVKRVSRPAADRRVAA